MEPGDLERRLRRVDFMERTVVERHFDIYHRIAGENAAVKGLLNAFFRRIDKFLRNDAAVDLVQKDETFPRSSGFTRSQTSPY